MTRPFGNVYARAYDFAYADKDYEAEAGLIDSLFARFAEPTVKQVLDIGCGTGGHAIPLAQRKYAVTGIDISPDMIEIARGKGQRYGLDTNFFVEDVRDLHIEGPFDAAIAMFAVLGYQLTNDDLLSALTNIRGHLTDEGLFIFDVWYGPAVLTQRPEARVRVKEHGKSTLIRASSGHLDIANQVCEVDIQIWELEDGRLKSSGTERHSMRYFFPQELDLLLRASGFTLARLGCFPEVNQDPDEASWNVIGIARCTN